MTMLRELAQHLPWCDAAASWNQSARAPKSTAGQQFWRQKFFSHILLPSFVASLYFVTLTLTIKLEINFYMKYTVGLHRRYRQCTAVDLNAIFSHPAIAACSNCNCSNTLRSNCSNCFFSCLTTSVPHATRYVLTLNPIQPMAAISRCK